MRAAWDGSTPWIDGATAAMAATALARRRARRWKKSSIQIAPVSTNRQNRIRAKSQLMATTPCYYSKLFVLDLKYGQESLLGDFHITDLFHALLACLLPLKQLLLAGNVPAITFRQNVLAQS